MKIFKYIVINKNNMKELHHYATADLVSSYLNGKKIENIIVLINEKTVVHLSDLNTSDIFEIEKKLKELS